MPIVSLPEGISGLRYAHRCAELVEVAARHGLFRANCLHKSIALCGLLRRLGLPARLRIGVLPRSRPLQAHAWVELDNNPLGTPDVGGYRAFDPRTRAHEQLVFS